MTRFYSLILVFLLASCSVVPNQEEAQDEKVGIEQETEQEELQQEEENASTENSNKPPEKDINEKDNHIMFGQTITTTVDGQTQIVNPNELFTIVNKTNTLPKDYRPVDLVIPDIPFVFEEIIDKRFIRMEAAESIKTLFESALKENIKLFAVSGFRSYERQEAIFQYQVSEKGEEEANKLVANPGQSEHQLGLALDVSSDSVNFQLVEDFGETTEGKWLQQNAYKYGFIVRYPKELEAITGYQYEPWHLRYVGKEIAEYLHQNNLTLDELPKHVARE